MTAWIAWLIALISISAFTALWFWEVRRVLLQSRSMLESAGGQLRLYRKKADGKRYDPELAAVLYRSESIYRQAVEHYNRTLHKPWVYLPGRLMGFQATEPDDGADEAT